MDAVGLGHRGALQVEALQDARDQQRGEPLPVRRALDQPPAAIRRRDRLNEIRGLEGEIVRGPQPAGGRDGFCDVLSRLAAIESVMAMARDPFERPGGKEIAHPRTGGRRRSAGQQGRGRRRVAAQQVGAAAAVATAMRGVTT